MFQRLKSMFYMPKRERPNPDLISAQITIAVQRNERAGQTARDTLSDYLSRSDGLGHKHE